MSKSNTGDNPKETQGTYERTSPVCPTNFLVVKPVFKSHSLKVLSQLADKANCPSEEMAMSETKWLCPCRIFFGKPNEDSSRVNCQTMIVLSIGQLKSWFERNGPTPGGGQDHVGVLGRGSDGSDPVRVAG
jgi:hypothetical protein